MNYLAHTALAGSNEGLVLGAFLGDHVKGPLRGGFSASVERGIALHRAIDTFTDEHPVTLRSRTRLQAPFRRYAGILIDMYYDHFLAKEHWRYLEEPINTISARAYRVLTHHCDQLPDSLRRFSSYMIQRDLLPSYGELDTISRALTGIGHRLRHANPLNRGAEPLIEHRSELLQDFHDFYPELQNYVLDWRAENR